MLLHFHLKLLCRSVGGQWYILTVTYRSLTFKNYTLRIDAEVIKGKQTSYTNCMIIKRIMCYIRLIILTLSMLSMSSVIVLTLNKTIHKLVTSYELNKARGNVQSVQNVKSVQFSQVWCERDLWHLYIWCPFMYVIPSKILITRNFL